VPLFEAARGEELREELLRELPGKQVVEEGKQVIRQKELRKKRHGQLGQVVQLESVA
jgi:predicted ABC-class ATPase